MADTDEKFKKSEKVFVTHHSAKGVTMYAAKIMDTAPINASKSKKSKKLQYKVHYHGWNSKWDEWLPKSRLRKFTPPNVALKKEMDASLRKPKAVKEAVKTEKASSAKQSSSSAATKSKKAEQTKSSHSARTKDTSATVGVGKRKRPAQRKAAAEQKKAKTRKSAPKAPTPPPKKSAKKTKMPIPFELRKQLVQDWENIHKHQLVPLPRKPTVAKILSDWAASKQQQKKGHIKGDVTETIQVLVKGLTGFFSDSLEQFLLYRFEREQLEDEMRRHKKEASASAKQRSGEKRHSGASRSKKCDFDPSSVYGAEHFLRLFVKLPTLMEEAGIQEEDAVLFSPQLVDLLKFLAKHRSGYFLSNYQPADEQYKETYERAQNSDA